MLNQLISSKGMGEWRLDKTSQQDVRLWKPDTEVMDSRLEGFSARPKLLQYLCSKFTLIATSDITKAASNSTLQRVSPCGNYTAGAPIPAFCATRTSKKVTKTRPVTEPKEVSSRATSPNLTSFRSYADPLDPGKWRKWRKCYCWTTKRDFKGVPLFWGKPQLLCCIMYCVLFIMYYVLRIVYYVL